MRAMRDVRLVRMHNLAGDFDSHLRLYPVAAGSVVIVEVVYDPAEGLECQRNLILSQTGALVGAKSGAPSGGSCRSLSAKRSRS